MTKVVIEAVGRRQLLELISSADGLTLSDDERKMFNRCAMASTRYWIGLADGALVCIWGLIAPTLLSDRAYLWLYTTRALDDNTFLFVRWSQRMIELMLREYPTIAGHVVSDNADGKRWLGWLGAKFGERDGPLMPFEIRAKHG